MHGVPSIICSNNYFPTCLLLTILRLLLDLQAAESIDAIEKAYKEGPMDEMVCGIWARVQIDLGLATADDFTAEELRHKESEWMDSIKAITALRERSHKEAPTARKSTAIGSKLCSDPQN